MILTTAPQRAGNLSRMKTRWSSSWRRLALAAALLLPASSSLAQDMTDSLPVTRVVLYTNGVAYFEHAGRIDGDHDFALPVDTDNMDDLLQSLVLRDHDGGSIRAVRYAAEVPLERTLSSYSLDLSGNPSLASLLRQARGEEVELDGAESVSGVIVSVETVTAPEEADQHYLLLATDAGLRRIALEGVTSLQFVNEQLRSELAAALGAVAQQREDAQRSVQLEFRGEGERFVQIGYVREMPVWKTSYRLVTNGDSSAELQGWAIFDNPTPLDLEDVQVTFVAGQPVSFITSLYEAVYVRRHRVEPPTSTAVGPTSFSSGAPAPMAAPAPVFEEAESFAADVAARASLLDMGVEAMASGVETGVTFQYVVDEPVTVGRFESAMIPIVQQQIPAQNLSVFDPMTGLDSPLRALLLQNDTGLHLAAGTVTVFEAGSFSGTALMEDVLPGSDALLAYAVDQAVTVRSTRGSAPEQVLSLRVADGSLLSEVRLRYRTRYEVAGEVEENRLVAIEHSRQPGYELVSPAEPAPLSTGSAFRFGVLLGADQPAGDLADSADSDLPVQLECPAAADSACLLEVIEEYVASRRVALSSMGLDDVLLVLENELLDEETQELLQQFADVTRQLTEVQRQLAEVERRRSVIFEEQGRIRANMAELDQSSSLYQRYVSQLNDQEDELEELSERITELEQQRIELQRERDGLISSTGTPAVDGAAN